MEININTGTHVQEVYHGLICRLSTIVANITQYRNGIIQKSCWKPCWSKIMSCVISINKLVDAGFSLGDSFSSPKHSIITKGKTIIQKNSHVWNLCWVRNRYIPSTLLFILNDVFNFFFTGWCTKNATRFMQNWRLYEFLLRKKIWDHVHHASQNCTCYVQQPT